MEDGRFLPGDVVNLLVGLEDEHSPVVDSDIDIGLVLGVLQRSPPSDILYLPTLMEYGSKP